MESQRRNSSDVKSLSEYGGVCRVDATTEIGRRRQLAQFAVVPLLPSVTLLVYLLVEVVAYGGQYTLWTGLRGHEERLEGVVGGVVGTLQQEAAGVVVYVATNGTDILGSLSVLYAKTDAAVNALSWPPEGMAHYRTSADLHASLTRHRAKLTQGQHKVMGEIEYYSTVLSILLDWAASSLRQTTLPADLLPMLTAYTHLAAAASAIAAQRLLGTLYYIQGTLTDDLHALYVQAYQRGEEELKGVLSTYSQLEPIYDQKFALASELVTRYDQAVVEILQNSPDGEPAYYKAVSWERNVDYYLEIMGLIRQELFSNNVIATLESKTAETVQMLAYSVVIMVIILTLLVPFLMVNALQTMHSLRIYSSMMNRNNVELRKEKSKADTLLKEMLPKEVAVKLQAGFKVDAESFSEATVFFSDIPDFSEISRNSNPLEIVNLLNELYRFMDSHLERYDVYKVETIGCVYMVVSGIPIPNAGRHVREVAHLSLDLIENMADFIVPHMQDYRVHLRVGISSGPCVAGVVGLKAPRYCLFGDTVNTAARMQTNGLSDRVHISPSTQKMLEKEPSFTTEYRGKMEIKGKGKLHTYWLLAGGGTPQKNNHSDSSGAADSLGTAPSEDGG